jgi:hypothetical protein
MTGRGLDPFFLPAPGLNPPLLMPTSLGLVDPHF